MWGLKVKDGNIVGGGLNIVYTGTFDYVLPTTEQFARQFMKLELVDGELKVKDGAVIQSIEELNQEKEDIDSQFFVEIAEPETVDLFIPVNIEPAE